MDYTCANCVSRTTWDCEDRHQGFWDTKRCEDFKLDWETLDEEEKAVLYGVAVLERKLIESIREEYGN